MPLKSRPKRGDYYDIVPLGQFPVGGLGWTDINVNNYTLAKARNGLTKTEEYVELGGLWTQEYTMIGDENAENQLLLDMRSGSTQSRMYMSAFLENWDKLAEMYIDCGTISQANIRTDDAYGSTIIHSRTTDAVTYCTMQALKTGGDNILFKVSDEEISMEKTSGSAEMKLVIENLPTYADNTAASSLSTGTVYKTTTGELKIKY